MRYHLFQKFFGKMVKIKETSFLSTRGMYLSCHGCTYVHLLRYFLLQVAVFFGHAVITPSWKTAFLQCRFRGRTQRYVFEATLYWGRGARPPGGAPLSQTRLDCWDKQRRHRALLSSSHLVVGSGQVHMIGILLPSRRYLQEKLS